jgi:P4 family phage/plasmid primase-like protien
MNTNNLFDLVNSQEFNMKEFLETHYNITFKRNKAVCPFHGDDEKSPNFSYAPKLNTCKCFVCEEGGDLINFIVKFKNITKLQACCEILDLSNIPYQHPNNKETTVETAQEIEQRKKEFEESQAKREAKRQSKEKELLIAKQNAINSMNKKAPIFSKTYDDEIFNLAIEADHIFPNLPAMDDKWIEQYIGYDNKHKSFCILNRLEDGTTFNIKHREKFVYDFENKKHLSQRVAGKWLSNIDSTTYAFPYDYFAQHEDERVFIVEGEKDALNLLSYDINVLTLGGVSNSWTDHKEILKDKIVYIWFDNDNAGYKSAIERYNEISDVAKEVYIVLFYHINPSLANKYDISDFIKDQKFQRKDDILHSIAYSSYKLTTSLIEDIEHHTSLDLKEYYFNQQTVDFRGIKSKWNKAFENNDLKITVKGRQDIEGIEDFFDIFSDIKNKKDFKVHARDTLIDIFLEHKANQSLTDDAKKEKALHYTTIASKMIENYKKIYNQYRQTGVYDMFMAFEQLSKKTGFTLAKYDDSLAVWTGTHYHVIDDRKENFKGFLATSWMDNAKIDPLKRTKRNVDEIFENLHLRSISLNEIHEQQKDKRAINFKNGTLFINKRGKRTFINTHDKKHAVMNMLEFDYNENATCPKWDKFLNRVLPNADDQATLMEFIGYCFFPGHDYEAFLFLYGKTGANGKSVILDVIRMFFGEENTSNLNIQNFVGQQLQGLANKLVNIGSELDSKGLNDGQMGVLKALTSTNDAIQVDPKHIKGYPLASRHQPKCINAGNSKPNPKVMDDGVYRRGLFLEFDSEIKDDEKVRNLSDRFTDELSGIMALALRNLDTLVKKSKFTKSQRLLDGIEEYKDQTNPIRAYVKEALGEDENIIIPKKLLYAHYKTWMEEKGFYTTSEPKFFQALKEHIKIEDKKQVRLPKHDPLVEILKTERPSFIGGAFNKSDDLVSFIYEKEEFLTKNLNRDSKSKTIVIKENYNDN